ncbi:MAG: hypothetical protein ACI9MC_002001 [Kiritimatiellia bacterium]|jgi:hypothetical protein
MLLNLLWMAANAASPGHYHPADIAMSSELYTQTAEKASGTFSDRQELLDSVAVALADYREGLDLLGDRAPRAEQDRLATLEKRFNRERAVLSAFASIMMEDFNEEFTQAMERAIPAGAVACQPRVATGPSLPGIPARTQPNADCKGTSVSKRMGSALDADPTLQTAVREIMALSWPTITVDSTAQAPIGEATTWIATSAFFRKAANATLKRIDKQDTDARLDFEAALEQELSKEQLQAMLGKAHKITAATAQMRAAAAAPTLDAVDQWSAKRLKKGETAVSWCASPALLGGCTGTDGTRSPGKALLVDKKIAKTLP